MRRAVYPGTFDPCTNGHLDIIERGSGLFDELIVAVLANGAKTPLFSADERVAMLSGVTSGMPGVRIESFDGLLVDFAKSSGASVVIRGLRALSDFEYEFQMALTNRVMNDRLETLFLPTSSKYMFLSSSVVKEIAKFGGDVDGMVPPSVAARLRGKR